MAQDVVLGIDIGGTGIKFGLVTRNGEILHTDKVKTKGYPKPDPLPEDLKTHCRTTEKTGCQSSWCRNWHPNGNYFDGTIDQAPNLPWKGLVPMKALFKNIPQTGCPDQRRQSCRTG